MREIKFKAKLSHSKQWVIGNLVIAQNGQPYIIPSEVFYPDGHHLKIDSDEPYWVDKETISQFTGLTDKSGVEIYEGDMLKSKDSIGHIEFDKYKHTYFLECGMCEFNPHITHLSGYNIIGNIHDK